MFAVGTGGCMQAGACASLSPSLSACCSNVSWVQTQHSMPLPPHHRPRVVLTEAAVGSVSLQAFPEHAHCSPQGSVVAIRKSHAASADLGLARWATRDVKPGLVGCSVHRAAPCTHAATQGPQTIAEPTTAYQSGIPLQSAFDSGPIGTGFPAPQRMVGTGARGSHPAVPASGDETSGDGTAVAGLQGVGQPRPADRASSGATDGRPMASGSVQSSGRNDKLTDDPCTAPVLSHPPEGDHARERSAATNGQQDGPSQLSSNNHTHHHPQQQLLRGQQQWQGHRRQQRRQQEDGVALTPPCRTPGSLPNREAADKALLLAILRCPSWRHLRELLRNHQQQHMEASRLAAAAAVGASSVASQRADQSTENDPLLLWEQQDEADQVQQEAQLQLAPAPVDARPGFPPRVVGQSEVPRTELAQVQYIQKESLLMSQSDMHLLQQQPIHPTQQWQSMQQLAFTPRHLVTALHVTSLRVSDPSVLSHTDRMQLGEFLRALGRGCASLASREPFPPVDLTMGLRALARLLGDNTLPPSPSAAAAAFTVPSGGRRVAAELYGGGRDDEQPEEHYDGQFSGWRSRQVAHEQEHEHDYYDGDDDGDIADYESKRGSELSSSRFGMARRPMEARAREQRSGGADPHSGSRRGPLHVAWLCEAWVNRMLEPTVESFLEDFEPRHVSGTLWALATLGTRPRPELLHALCKRAADCARENIATRAAGSSSSRHAAAGAPGDLTNSRNGMTAQGLSLTLWALARLGFQPGQPSLDALLSACRADMQVAASRSVAAAATTVALATQARQGPGATAAARPAVSPCCSLDLAQRAWALASLGCHPGDEWLELMVEAFLTRGSVEQVSGQSCSMMMWALARLHALSPSAPRPLQPEDATDSASRSAGAADENSMAPAEGLGTAAAADSDSNEAVFWELLRDRAESGRGASTSGRGDAATAPVAARAAEAGYRAAAEETEAESEADLQAWMSTGDSLGSSSPSVGFLDSVDMATAAAAMPLGGVPVLRQPGRVIELLAMLQDALERMSSQHLATVLWALSSLDVRPSQAWLEAFLEATGRRLTAALVDSQPFGPQSLAMTLGALARLRYRPPAAWMARFMEVCRRELPSFGSHSVCVLAWALVRLSYKPRGDWRRAFAARTQRLLPAMSCLGLCLLLWSLASWRSRPPLPWIRTALTVSAGHLRTGGEAWARNAAALEEQVLAATTGVTDATRTEPLSLPPPCVLRTELLAVMLWSMSHLVTRPPPASWLALADTTTQAVMRYSRAAAFAAAAAASGTVTSGSGPHTVAAVMRPPSPRQHAAATLAPRTLAMLLQGWARFGRPPAEGFLIAAMSYVAEAAAVAGGGGANGIRRQQREAAEVDTTPVSAATVFRSAEDMSTVGPQHVVIVLWSCAVMGLEPPASLVKQLVALHADLLWLQSQQRSRLQRAGHAAVNSTDAASGTNDAVVLPSTTAHWDAGDNWATLQLQSAESNTEAYTADATYRGDAQRRMQQAVLAQELLARQPELGMLVWALIRFGVASPPKWLPAVLAAVGCTLEQDASAAASGAAGASTTGSSEASPLHENVKLRVVTWEAGQPSSQPGPQQDQASAGASVPTSSITLLTVKTLARACLVWHVHPGDRWLAAASACLDAGALGTKVRRAYGRSNLESEVRYLLEQLQSAGDSTGVGGQGTDGAGDGAGPRQQDSVAAAWAAAAVAAAGSGAVLTNAVAAVAAGSAAAWMQVLVW